MPRKRLNLVCILSLSLALASCKGDETNTFQDPEPLEREIIDLEKVRVPGGGIIEMENIQITGDMTHPEFIGRWSNLKREINVDLYVLTQRSYDELVEEPVDLQSIPRCPPPDPEDPNPAPPDSCVLWTSVPEEGVAFGDHVVTRIHVHPWPDRWVMVFHNPNTPGQLATEAELSGKLWIRWFE